MRGTVSRYTTDGEATSQPGWSVEEPKIVRMETGRYYRVLYVQIRLEVRTAAANSLMLVACNTITQVRAKGIMYRILIVWESLGLPYRAEHVVGQRRKELLR
jgi:hypothetical protein